MNRQDDVPNCSTTRTLCAVVCLATLIALCAHPAHAAMTEAWVQTYDGPGHKADYAKAVVMDHAGNVIVTGSFSNSTNDLFYSPEYRDIYTAKYAARDGALLWERLYNGPGNDYDAPSAMAVDKHGNVIVAGVSENAGISSMYVAKYASTKGALLWEQRIGGQGSSVLIGGGGPVPCRWIVMATCLWQVVSEPATSPS